MTETLRNVIRVLDDVAVVQDVIDRDVPMLAADWGTKDEDAFCTLWGLTCSPASHVRRGTSAWLSILFAEPSSGSTSLFALIQPGLIERRAGLLHWSNLSDSQWKPCWKS